jgi:hypothetical protein
MDLNLSMNQLMYITTTRCFESASMFQLEDDSCKVVCKEHSQ